MDISVDFLQWSIDLLIKKTSGGAAKLQINLQLKMKILLIKN